MGMTQRDVMGREVGGRFMFGNACTPVVDSCQCMGKPFYCHKQADKWVRINFKKDFFFNFYFYFILLYNTVLVLPYIDMNPPQVYMHSQT